MTIKIIKPGLLSTIQDLGRFGSQKYGVIVGGAMDSIALRIANILVGNAEGEAVIEVTMFGTEIQILEEKIVAVTGGNLSPKVDGKEIPMWRPILLKKDQVITFKSPTSGCRAYLTISGGLDVPKVMESKSTHIHAKIGGYQGRKLEKGDIISCGESTELSKLFLKQIKASKLPYHWFAAYPIFYNIPKTNKIRVLKGSEFDYFNKESQRNFFNNYYEVTKDSNRMGYQLEGPKLALNEQFEVLSEGVTYGTIQVPSNGKPIILMAERQTTGGYPKIGEVATVDLPKLAQLQPRNKIKFEIISLEEAEKLLIDQENAVQELKVGLQLKAAEATKHTSK